MKATRILPWLLAAVLCCSAGCETTTPPPAQDVQTVPETGVGTFGGPGALGGGGQKPAMPTNPPPAG
ncbi:MAG TPA: hypothetical protein VD994_12175 [Prosthecobacter sp.]|nr:hypothetical protein [Prosthecobacter sp.]